MPSHEHIRKDICILCGVIFGLGGIYLLLHRIIKVPLLLVAFLGRCIVVVLLLFLVGSLLLFRVDGNGCTCRNELIGMAFRDLNILRW